MIQEQSPSATAVLLPMAAAYKTRKNHYTHGVGTFQKFSKKKIQKGYKSYASIFPPNAEIAPLGLGYQCIKENYGKRVFQQLYSEDGIHPSPHGTYLEACILYCVIVGEELPTRYGFFSQATMGPINGVPCEWKPKLLLWIPQRKNIYGKNTVNIVRQTDHDGPHISFFTSTVLVLLLFIFPWLRVPVQYVYRVHNIFICTLVNIKDYLDSHTVDHGPWLAEKPLEPTTNTKGYKAPEFP